MVVLLVVVVVEVVMVVVEVVVVEVNLVGSVEAEVSNVRNLILDLKTSGVLVVVGGGEGGGEGGRVGGGEGGEGGGEAIVRRAEEGPEDSTRGPARCRIGLIDGRGGKGRRWGGGCGGLGGGWCNRGW